MTTGSSEGTTQRSEHGFEEDENGKNIPDIAFLGENKHPPLTTSNLNIHVSLLPSSTYCRAVRAVQFVDRQSSLVQLEQDLQKDLAKERRKARRMDNLRREKSTHCAIMDRLAHPFHISHSSAVDSNSSFIAIGYHQYRH